MALVKQGDDYQLVDVDGVRLSTTADPASVKLPVIDGGAGTIGKDLFQATTAVLGALPANVLAQALQCLRQVRRRSGTEAASTARRSSGATRGRRSSRRGCLKPC